VYHFILVVGLASLVLLSLERIVPS